MSGSRPIGMALRFGTLLLASSLALHLALSAGLRRYRGGGIGVWNDLAAGRIGSELLVVGSSRALDHFNCRILSERLGMSCFNLGFDGSAPNLQTPQLRLYLDRNRVPRVVLVSLDSTSLEIRRNLYEPEQYLTTLHEPLLYDTLARLDPDVRFQRWVPLYAFSRFGLPVLGRALRGIAGGEPRGSEARTFGFRPLGNDWDGTFETFRRAHRRGKSFPHQPEAVVALRAMLRLAKDTGAEVLLVYSPELVEGQALSKNREEIFATFRSLSDSLSIPFLDYSHHEISGRRQLFVNSQHLGGVGADVFSAALADDLVRLIQPDVAPAPTPASSASP